jgi:outer membrane lipoprotein-sorting protein
VKLSRLHLILTLLLSLAGSAPDAAAAEAIASSNEQAWAELSGILEKTGEVETYYAEFEQQKFTPLLRNPIESTGKVRITPDVSRWDTEAPYASTMVIAGGEMRLFYPEQQTLEVYDLGDRVDTLAASPVPRAEVLREYFELAESEWDESRSTLRVTLLPRTDEVRDAVEEATVQIEAATGLLRELEMSDADGEVTVIRFTQIRLNPELRAEALALEVPAGTQTVRPLDDVE